MKWLINFFLTVNAIAEGIDSNLYMKIKNIINFIGDYVSINTNLVSLILFRSGIIISVIFVHITDISIFHKSVHQLLFDDIFIFFINLYYSYDCDAKLRKIKNSDDSTIMNYSITRQERVRILTNIITQPCYVMIFVIIDIITKDNYMHILEIILFVVISLYVMYIFQYIALVMIDIPPTKRKKLSFSTHSFATHGA